MELNGGGGTFSCVRNSAKVYPSNEEKHVQTIDDQLSMKKEQIDKCKKEKSDIYLDIKKFGNEIEKFYENAKKASSGQNLLPIKYEKFYQEINKLNLKLNLQLKKELKEEEKEELKEEEKLKEQLENELKKMDEEKEEEFNLEELEDELENEEKEKKEKLKYYNKKLKECYGNKKKLLNIKKIFFNVREIFYNYNKSQKQSGGFILRYQLQKIRS